MEINILEMNSHELSMLLIAKRNLKTNRCHTKNKLFLQIIEQKKSEFPDYPLYRIDSIAESYFAKH
jgi:hypothetical protein